MRVDQSHRTPTSSRANTVWRVTASGIGWALFAVVALLLAVVVLPYIRLSHRHEADIGLRAQRMLHRAARSYVRVIGWIGVNTLDASACGDLPRSSGYLVAANHPTLLDVVFMLSILPQADCIVAGERADHWLLRDLVRGAGWIRNDVGDEIVDECARRIRAGRTVLIFPEGTRSPRGGLAPLQRGVARIALAAGCAIQPILITCDPPALGKGRPWYDVPPRRFAIEIRPLDPISSLRAREAILREQVPRSRVARSLTAELSESFSKGLDIAVA